MIARLTGAFGALAALSLAGCASGPQEPPPAIYDEPFESILAWRIDASNELVVRFESNGCTTRDSFELQVFQSQAGPGQYEVGFVRRYADRCRALLPQGVPLSWTKAELGVPATAEVYVLNPIDNGRPPLPAGPDGSGGGGGGTKG